MLSTDFSCSSMASETEGLRLLPSFDGRFDALPYMRVWDPRFLATRYLHCSGGRRVFVASLPSEIVGGTLVQNADLMSIALCSKRG